VVNFRLKVFPKLITLAWGNDSQTVFYTKVDAAHRPFKLFRHQLSSPISKDVLVYHEADESYFLSISKTRSEAYLLISLSSKITTEVHYLDAFHPTNEFQTIRPRSVGWNTEWNITWISSISLPMMEQSTSS
jgi:oligopeptidase B